jgi:hypothetical protein
MTATKAITSAARSVELGIGLLLDKQGQGVI